MNIQALMKQAQQVQGKIQKAQEELKNHEFTGNSGGGMVEITINGAFQTKKVQIDESLLEKSEKEILEDLIVAAFNDAKKKADEGSENLMKDATQGMNLPKGFAGF